MAAVPVTVRLDISYDGSFAFGFQKQKSLVSVQGTVESALRAMSGSFVPVVGASRTDRGVHALHNVVSFVLKDEALLERVERRLPLMMPEWLTILSCTRADNNFSARFSTVAKTYAYVFIKKGCWSPFLARYGYRLDYPASTVAMSAAAHAFLGTHDFSRFGNVDSSRPHQDTKCTIHAIDVVETSKAVILSVSGDHFLYHMVRRMAYFVIKAGQGRIGSEVWNNVFSGLDTPYTRQVIAAGGLYLVDVDYA
ncbi:MAG: tRNA pseudouridine(38-40) synthase TruA [Candidatus Cryosericum sp.]|nr:tRNA pseudouridine(38-40) synthase TruA [bacterium]